MPILSINSQPDDQKLMAAYRPIVLTVAANRTDTSPQPPVVYCDIYVNGKFYKSQEKTQFISKDESSSIWQFDIQDACQEILKTVLGTNGGTNVIEDQTSMAALYCKFRSSGFDNDGFIVSENTAPVQGTGANAPVSGTGTQSNTFYVTNATLQHDQNQDLQQHLSFYKPGKWTDDNVFSLTHRPSGYKVCRGDSDYFPIASMSIIGIKCLQINYKVKGSSEEFESTNCDTGGGGCVPPTYGFIFAQAHVGVPYTRVVGISGSAPFTFTSVVIPSWMEYEVDGDAGTITFTGTPTAAATEDVTFTVSNDCGSEDVVKTITTLAAACVPVSITGSDVHLPDGVGDIYYDFSFNLTGDAPFTITPIEKPDWMAIAAVGNEVQITGTPSYSDAATNIEVSFDISNCGGVNSIPYTDYIDVTALAHFVATTFVSSDEFNNEEIANLVGVPGSTVTLELVTLTNTNGGTVEVDGDTSIAENDTFDIVLDGSGEGSINTQIHGVPHVGSSVILMKFQIVGRIPDSTGSTYQNSRVF